MTEAEWLTSTDPRPMLDFLCGRVPERKSRLFGVACCRRLWRWSATASPDFAIDEDRLATALDEIERVADGVREEPSDWFQPRPWRVSEWHAARAAMRADASAAAEAVQTWVSVSADQSEFQTRGGGVTELLEEMAAQCGLLRCVIGNPFRPTTADPAWLTSAVTALARQMYDSLDFTAMPILADALQDAGCDSDDVLNHCRSDGVHVRGCWVVDALLGKE
jgi:hypothetical protein